MKIIHCADVHLDSKLTANLPKEKVKARNMELLRTFIGMAEYARDHRVKAIVIAGDLFDTRRVSATVRNSVYDVIEKHPAIDFYYLKGNHDTDNFLEDLEVIPTNLKMFGDSWDSYTVNPEQVGSVVITGVELDDQNTNTVYSSLVLDQNKFNIVVMHGQESVYKAKDKTECINLGALKNKGIDYLALGHVHSYKEGELDKRGTYCYSGCLEGRGFDECGPCGFVLLDIDEEQRTYTSEFIPFSYRQLYAKEVDISGCMTSTEIFENIQEILETEQIGEESLVKIILKGNVDVECEKNIEFLLKQFEEKYYFIKIYDETKLAVDYQSFALDESLKGEFVRTVMADEHMDEDTKAEIIRCGIQALSGEEME